MARKRATKQTTMDRGVELALDAAGTADPTGVVDVIHSAKLLKEGRVVDAALTGIGVVPYIGDLGKVLKRMRKAPGADQVTDAVDDVVHAGTDKLLRKGGVAGWRQDRDQKAAAARTTVGPEASTPIFGVGR
ncbi:MAG: hypothetical protein AAF556_10930 [Pseudomonadota bacterium]